MYGKDYEKLISALKGKYTRQQVHQHVFQVKQSLVKSAKGLTVSKSEGLTAQVARMVNTEDQKLEQMLSLTYLESKKLLFNDPVD